MRVLLIIAACTSMVSVDPLQAHTQRKAPCSTQHTTSALPPTCQKCHLAWLDDAQPDHADECVSPALGDKRALRQAQVLYM